MSAAIAFTALNLLTWFVADCVDPGLREPQYGRKLAVLKEQLAQFAGRPLVLFLGTSRTAYGVRPEALGSAPSPDQPFVFILQLSAAGRSSSCCTFAACWRRTFVPRPW